GFRGAAIGGGFRGVWGRAAAIWPRGRAAAVCPGVRAAPICPGVRRAAVGPRVRAAAIWPGVRRAAIGPGFRAAAIGRGFRVGAFRRRGFFLAGAGLGFAATYPYYYSGYYSDPCAVWDGYEWVNVCYPYY